VTIVVHQAIDIICFLFFVYYSALICWIKKDLNNNKLFIIFLSVVSKKHHIKPTLYMISLLQLGTSIVKTEWSRMGSWLQAGDRAPRLNLLSRLWRSSWVQRKLIHWFHPCFWSCEGGGWFCVAKAAFQMDIKLLVGKAAFQIDTAVVFGKVTMQIDIVVLFGTVTF